MKQYECNKDAYATEDRWLWCMNWCKKQGLAPANTYSWTLANNMYDKLIKKEEIMTDSEKEFFDNDLSIGQIKDSKGGVFDKIITTILQYIFQPGLKNC